MIFSLEMFRHIFSCACSKDRPFLQLTGGPLLVSEFYLVSEKPTYMYTLSLNSLSYFVLEVRK